jgi:hypothetical protein
MKKITQNVAKPIFAKINKLLLPSKITKNLPKENNHSIGEKYLATLVENQEPIQRLPHLQHLQHWSGR